MRRHLPKITLLFIVLLAAGLRLYMLDGQSFWADEGNSVVLAQKSVSDIITAAAADIHPPAYYLLLKQWARVFGLSETGARSLSVLFGILTVWGLYLLGTALKGQRVGLLAALLAAINPFFIHYSQEARMYQLLALTAVLSAYALVLWWQRALQAQRSARVAVSGLYLVMALLGLYTHYAFPIHLIALNVAWMIWLWGQRDKGPKKLLRDYLAPWALLQALVMILFLPWLPTALHQIRTWPRPPTQLNALMALAHTLQLFLCGPTPRGFNVVVLTIIGLFSLGLAGWGIWRQMHTRALSLARALLPLLWLLAPLLAMLVAGAFTPTFFKFLLLALPAWLLLLALGIDAVGIPGIRRPKRGDFDIATVRAYLLTPILLLMIALPASASLNRYYHDPDAARDDYRGLAAWLKATARAGDAIILDAPGQNDAFSQYDHGPAPVYLLPDARPPEPTRTRRQLDAILQNSQRIFAIYWATEQADPDNIIENYLIAHAFKAWDAWVGHLRFVAYSAAPPPELLPRPEPTHFGDAVVLQATGLSTEPLQPGDIARVQLSWMATAPLDVRYKVTLQLLDLANQVVAQVDSEPAGGTQPTTGWIPGNAVLDGYGLAIPLATPPGDYPLIVALYDAETGQRPTVSGPGSQGDYLVLGKVQVIAPQQVPPRSILPIRYDAEVRRNEVLFLGHNRFKQGYSHAPETPLQPGDILHLTTFWQAERTPAEDYLFEIRLGDAPLGRYALAGPGYLPTQWLPGLPWRGEHAILLPADLATGHKQQLSLQVLTPAGESVGKPILLGPKLLY
jgi:4-amino-4-deoxy-L-arabinose transferase-like glycosyltransferase